MDSVLIISGSQKSAESIGELINSVERHKISYSTNGSEARRLISEKDFDLLIINSPLTDELGSELAMLATERTMAGVMLIVKADIYNMVVSKVENYGVLALSKPINRSLFNQTLRLVKATEKRMKGFRQENVKLKNQITEMRMTDRAKAVLMQYLKLTEPQAHRFIVKQAMDMRITKLEVAQNILKTYEN